MYGNGGLSSWTRQFVANMNSHENSQEGDAEAKIEFCYGGATLCFNGGFWFLGSKRVVER